MTSHALRRALDAELAREKITLRQWEVLAWIALEGEPSQVELAQRLGIEAPTLAGVLARMERDGWLERSCCQDDRRKKRIRATAKAEAVWNRMGECCRRVRERATAGFSDDELQEFKGMCERIRGNLDGDNSLPAVSDQSMPAVSDESLPAVNGAPHDPKVGRIHRNGRLPAVRAAVPDTR